MLSLRPGLKEGREKGRKRRKKKRALDLKGEWEKEEQLRKGPLVV
jgi:hypothetical protein